MAAPLTLPFRVIRLALTSTRPSTRRFSAIAALHLQHPAAKPDGEIPFLPRFLQPTTYIPSWSRRRQQGQGQEGQGVGKKLGGIPGKVEWNPATFFIWIFLLIGSQAIHTLRLKHEHSDFMRKSEARIGVLGEVVKRLGNGEEVDVEKALGTGKVKDEEEWKRVLKEIEEEDRLWNTRPREMVEEKVDGEKERGGEDEKKPAPGNGEKRRRTARDYDIL